MKTTISKLQEFCRDYLAFQQLKDTINQQGTSNSTNPIMMDINTRLTLIMADVNLAFELLEALNAEFGKSDI